MLKLSFQRGESFWALPCFAENVGDGKRQGVCSVMKRGIGRSGL